MPNHSFQHARARVAAAAGLGLLVTGTVGVMTVAPAAALEGTVSIRVEMDLPGSGAGPLVFVANDVVVGDGPELVGTSQGADTDNWESNPSNWGGDLTVDVDPVARTITVMGGEDPWDFETVLVTVTSSEVGALTLVSDGLFPREDCEAAPDGEGSEGEGGEGEGEGSEGEICGDIALLIYGLADGVATFSWTLPESAVTSGASVFSYALPVEEEPVEEEPVEEEPVEEEIVEEQPEVVVPPAPSVLPVTNAVVAVALPTPPRVSE